MIREKKKGQTKENVERRGENSSEDKRNPVEEHPKTGTKQGRMEGSMETAPRWYSTPLTFHRKVNKVPGLSK